MKTLRLLLMYALIAALLGCGGGDDEPVADCAADFVGPVQPGALPPTCP